MQMESGNVYISEVRKILPKRYPAAEIVDKMYPVKKYGENTNRLVKKLANRFGIAKRASVINFDVFPKIELRDEKDHPRNWGRRVIDELTSHIDKDEIGMFSLSYNISYHTEVLPNLASQIISDSGLNNLDVNEEIPYYGCSASIYSLKNAVAYCKKYDRPAIVFAYDQCFAFSLQLEKEDEDFKKMIITSLLFTDGAVGMLVIPERLRNRYSEPLAKITNVDTAYKNGDLIKMKKGKFLMSSDVKDNIPKLVSETLVKPFFERNKLKIDDFKEWSIHQGGSEVLNKFCKEECLNLPPEYIERSMQMFYKYGNTSAASVLLIFDSFFNSPTSVKKRGDKGILIGFGAGYYLGIATYEWN